MDEIVIHPELPPNDIILLKNLADEFRQRLQKQQRHHQNQNQGPGPHPDDDAELATDAEPAAGETRQPSDAEAPSQAAAAAGDDDGSAGAAPDDYAWTARDEEDLARMKALNDPASPEFEPTVFSSVDLRDLSARLHPFVYDYVLLPYIHDVIMVTHLIIYFTTSVPSALWLFYRFTALHGVLHFAMQFYYMGTYTLMMHQHIHGGGVLRKSPLLIRCFDLAFPYLIDPLMGHSWNSYYYHHIKLHHVEGNGPDDLSSTLRYQRDSVWDFLQYLGRFYFLIWLDLPLYFLRKGRLALAAKAGGWELSYYGVLAALLRLRPGATVCALLLPLLLLRVGLMVGNWGQHAFVDPDEPDSDYRSSITLIDVPSNRYCFNDGYHTSHHLNPRRHWRDHPTHLLARKGTYGREGALVFAGIDYLEVTVRLLLGHYERLAARLVPVGARQHALTPAQRVDLLRRAARRFSEDEIRRKFRTAAAAAAAAAPAEVEDADKTK
ncbi:hypothetical protein GGS23DRAFT_602178 [Durotheca rogersii]|uniref:uncharacterized protein n=1 Tax=Durotheca rogersii TaxID=419775 RepID=UPI002220F5F1|nr:uncharacterized protein GGS23DRAFT_602178 [Durotheca rogersii]KAI5868382.1 hypothetical protein GGS23DRAFT_602178 [Durotheca rogersii]